MVLIIFCNYENNHIGLTKYQYKTNKLSKKFKIIQISDFHNKKIKNNNEQLINIVEKEKPNIIVITGDFIDSRKTPADIVHLMIKTHSLKFYLRTIPRRTLKAEETLPFPITSDRTTNNLLFEKF